MVKKLQAARNEEGFASLVIALTLIIILSLVTLGFAHFIRREQANALNKQLSMQAFYAAESGVNDIVKNLSTVNTLGTNLNDCSLFFQAGKLGASRNKIDGDNVKYTCALLNKEPGDLQHSKIGNADVENSNSNSWTIPAKLTSSPNSLTISWTSDTKRTDAPQDASTQFLPVKDASGANPDWSNTNKYMAVLRFNITPLASSADFARPKLTSQTRTYYLYPTKTASSTVSFSNSAANNGTVQPAYCDTSAGKCSIKLTGVNDTTYLFHVVSIYDMSTITITPESGAKFIDTQAVIDVTGKAQDVLRRIQVRYPLYSNVSLPSEALEAKDICKRMAVAPDTGTFYQALTNLAEVTGNGPCNAAYNP